MTAYEASLLVTDELAGLAGRLDAAINYGCPLTLDEVAALVEKARIAARHARKVAFEAQLDALRSEVKAVLR
jgi:hypothetical protein